MSEQINKVLASTAQAFTTAEQLQARTNIGAMGAGDMTAYLPFSAISADANSAITSINGSSVGSFSGVSSNNNVTGDGTSGSPVGLSAQISLVTSSATSYFNGFGMEGTSDPYTSCRYRIGGWSIYTNGDATHHHEIGANASGINLTWNTNYYWSNIHASGINQKDAWAPSRNSAEWAYTGATLKEYTGASAIFQASGLTLFNSASGTARKVDIDSIDRWNSYSANQAGWNESGNPLSTGFGGNPATAASQYNVGAGNWAARTVKMSGLPDQTMYGFQSRPNGTATYGVNQAGAFVAIPQSNYFTYLFHETGAAVHTFDLEIYPTGLTANARLDFVNLCSAASANVKTDSFHGNTASINPGESATMWYIATAGIWTDGGNPVPV